MKTSKVISTQWLPESFNIQTAEYIDFYLGGQVPDFQEKNKILRPIFEQFSQDVPEMISLICDTEAERKTFINRSWTQEPVFGFTFLKMPMFNTMTFIGYYCNDGGVFYLHLDKNLVE